MVRLCRIAFLHFAARLHYYYHEIMQAKRAKAVIAGKAKIYRESFTAELNYLTTGEH